MTTTKTAHLTVSEWQAVCLRNVEELHAALKGLAYPTDEIIGRIDQHMARWATFMRSWKLAGEQQNEPPKTETVQPAPVEAAPVKKKGGWPKGRSRKKADQQATVQ